MIIITIGMVMAAAGGANDDRNKTVMFSSSAATISDIVLYLVIALTAFHHFVTPPYKTYGSSSRNHITITGSTGDGTIDSGICNRLCHLKNTYT